MVDIRKYLDAVDHDIGENYPGHFISVDMRVQRLNKELEDEASTNRG